MIIRFENEILCYHFENEDEMNDLFIADIPYEVRQNITVSRVARYENVLNEYKFKYCELFCDIYVETSNSIPQLNISNRIIMNFKQISENLFHLNVLIPIVAMMFHVAKITCNGKFNMYYTGILLALEHRRHLCKNDYCFEYDNHKYCVKRGIIYDI